jgi:alanine racemase
VTLKLTVRSAMWRAHVANVVNSVDGLVPVVKGNGYGFGRAWLATVAAEFSDTVAVGTVHELTGLPGGVTPVVLTPTLDPPPSASPILTVGRIDHITALDGWNGSVVVKLASSMRRYGADPAGLDELVAKAGAAGLDVVGVSIHPPLVGADGDHRAEIEALIRDIDPELPIWVSHLDPDSYRALPPTHRYRLRLGTRLWHGDKSALQLSADVLDVRPVSADDLAGYRSTRVAADGHLVVVGTGSANGVSELPGGLSPFHFRRRRLHLHEAPHMHSSMIFVPDGDPLPHIGQWVDVQRPLTTTHPEALDWI